MAESASLLMRRSWTDFAAITSRTAQGQPRTLSHALRIARRLRVLRARSLADVCIASNLSGCVKSRPLLMAILLKLLNDAFPIPDAPSN
jgi:hypothetical protein